MIPNLNPDDLVIFYIVAKEKSLSSAADKVFLTQPAITYHIQALEKYTRVKLLEFKKRQVILTPHGKDLFKYAEEIYHQLNDAEILIKSFRESNLRLGIASIYDTLVGPLLPSLFEGQTPGAKLMVKSGNSFEMVQDVLDSTLDLAIVPQFDYERAKLNHIQVSQPQKIVCFASFLQTIEKEPLEWKDLYNYPLVVGPDSSVIRRIIIDKFREEGLEIPSLAAEVGTIEWCKTLVENGKGLSFTLEQDIAKQLLEGRLKLVPLKEHVYVTAEAVTRSDILSPVITRFISMVKRVFGYTETAGN